MNAVSEFRFSIAGYELAFSLREITAESRSNRASAVPEIIRSGRQFDIVETLLERRGSPYIYLGFDYRAYMIFRRAVVEPDSDGPYVTAEDGDVHVALLLEAFQAEPDAAALFQRARGIVVF